MKKLLIAFLMIATGISSSAQKIDRTKAPLPGPAPHIELGKYESFTLDNGLKVFVVENRKLPRISWQMYVNNDPVTEGKFAGYIDLMGSLLRTGTTSKTKAEIDEAIDFIGARVSTSSRGFYASSLSNHKEALLDIVSDILLHPSFSEEELGKLKTKTISGLAANKTNPGAMASNVSSVLDYGTDHPYGEQITEETVEMVNAAHCKSYYNTYFKPNVSYLIVVGDINLEEAKPLVEKYFSGWEKGNVPGHSYNMPEAPSARQVAFVDKPGAVQSTIRITYPVDLKPGTEDVIPASLMNAILGNSGFMARLIQDLREDHGYTYGAYSSLSTDRLVGDFTANAEVRNEVTDSAVIRFLFQMEQMINVQVSDEDLQNAKNYLSGQFARALERPQTVARFALNTALYNLPADYYATYLERVQAVTKADVQRMAVKYIKPDNCYIVVVGNRDEVAEKLQPFAYTGKVDFYDNYGNPASDLKPAPDGVSAQDIIDNYLKAIGGADKLSAVKSEKMVMGSTMQGMPITMTILIESPDKYMQQMQSNGMLISQVVINGDKGHMKGMMGEKDLEPEQMAEMKNDAVIFEQLLYKEKMKMMLLGIQNIEGLDAYKVEIVSEDGKSTFEFYDVATGYKVLEVNTQESPQGTLTITQSYSDYRDVDGIKVPYKVVLDQAGNVMEFAVQDAAFNIPIEASIFKL